MENLSFNIEGNSFVFIQKAEQMRNSINAITTEIKKASDVSNGWTNTMKKAFDVIGGMGVLKGFADDVIRVRSEIQQLEISFASLLQSKEKADILVSQMIAVAAQSPFDLETLSVGAKQLIESGVATEQVNEALLRLGDIALGVGIPLERLTGLYGKVVEQGHLYSDDLNQFAGTGIPMLESLASILGVTIEQIDEMVSIGKIGFPEVQKVVECLTNEGGKFYGLVDEQSKTIVGKLNSVSSAWDAMFNAVGESQEDVINNSLDGVKYVLENYEQLGRTILELAGVYGTYQAVLISLTALQKLHKSVVEQARLEMLLAAKSGEILTKSQAMSAAGTKLFTGAIKSNTAALLKNPYVFVAAAIVGLGYSIYKVTTAETELEKAHKRLGSANTDVEKSLSSEMSKLSSLEKKLVEVKKGSEEYNNIKKTIVDNYGQYYKGLDEEIERVGNLSTVYSQLVENMRLTIGQRKFESFFKAEQDSLDIIVSGKLEKAYEALVEKYGKTKGVNLYNQFFDSTMHGTALSPDVLEELRKATFWDIKWGNNAEDGIVDFKNNVFNLRSEIKKETKATEVILDEYKDKFKITDDEVTKILLGKSNKKEVGKNKPLYELIEDIRTTEKSIAELRKNAQKGIGNDNKLKVEITKLGELKESYKLKTGLDYGQKYNQGSQSDNSEGNIKRMREKQALDEVNFMEDMANRSVEVEIAAMREGEEKKLAQMKFNHQKEIAEIKRLRIDYLQKKVDSEKAIFEANPKNEGKTFDSSQVVLNKKEEDIFGNMLMKTLEKQGNDISVYYKDLISKYQGYSEKRLSIEEKFKKERDVLVKAGASKETLNEHDYQKEEALKSIDNEFAMREESFQSWTDSIANLSLEQLQRLLVQAEQELQRSEFLNPKDPNLAVQRTKISSLKKEINEKAVETETSPGKRSIEEWQNLYQTLSKVERGFDEVGDAVGGTAGEIISAAGGIASATLQMIDGIVTLATGSASAMSSTSQVASKSIQTVEKASVILAIIGAALQVATKIANMFGADYSDYNAAKENYENYVKVLDVVIGKQKELLETLTGKAAVEASQSALGLIEKQANAARTLGRERLNAGSSAGSHSIGVRIRKGMSREGWNEAENAIGTNAYNQIKDGRMTALFDLSVEQLEKLQMEAPTFWAKLDGDVRDYLEQIIACNDKAEEMKGLLKESLTQVSFDDVYNNFLDALSDMGVSTEEFADNFEKYMQKAILNSMLVDKYKSRINTWYEAFAKANEDGISTGEYENLQRDWNSIVSDAIGERNALMEQFDWSSEGSASQSSSQKGFAAMSQDTGDELNGRFTALQISNEEIKNSMLFVLGSLSSLCTTASDGNILLMEMRNLAIMSNGHLEDIAKYTKIMLGFGDKLDNIDRNTQKI